MAGLEADAWPVTTTPLEVAVRGLAMLAFEGVRLPAWLRDRLGSAPAAGVTIFRYANVEAPAQLRELTDALQAAAPASGPPLLIAADQEGGQLLGLGTGSTPFAGNMALGAAGDPALTERVARAIGTECRALGVNVDYAPVCDLATNPANPGLGVRAFGSEPARVAEHAAAFVRGLQAAGVAATLKHFPGKGEAAVDTHHELGLVTHDRARFETVELVPFRAALAAGARVVMSGHFAAPGLSGVPGLPGTLSREVMDRLLRAELGFQGVAISDALDMKALAQGPLQVLDVLAGLRAGLDVLLCTPDLAAQTQVEEGLVHAVRRQLLEEAGLRTSLARVAALRGWLAGAGAQPDLEAVGCAAHRALAREVAARSITLVRDDAALLPLQLTEAQRIAVIMPRPRDLTPADTSVFEAPRLAAAIRAHHPRVDEFVTGQPPTDEEVAALREQAAGYDLLVVGTISASLDPAQADLVHQLLASGVPLITVALRTPFDLMAYPEARTHLCSYSLLGPSLEALADALWGRLPLAGHLPAAIPGLYPVGHGEERPWA
ncbi:MAG: glycoside hydrolase family 3 protein [Candidatus Limnocylindrales bacterium]